MNIPVGSNIGIIGPTGCGKTTLIDIIIGLLKLKEGKFEIDGITINDNNSNLTKFNFDMFLKTFI